MSSPCRGLGAILGAKRLNSLSPGADRLEPRAAGSALHMTRHEHARTPSMVPTDFKPADLLRDGARGRGPGCRAGEKRPTRRFPARLL